MNVWQSCCIMNSRPSPLAGLHLFAQRLPDHSDHDASDIIQPDIVLPAQWTAAFRRHQRSGETKLLAGVLLSAWHDLDSPHRSVRLDAESFFEMPDAGKPLSLRFLCEAFELQVSVVQQVARERIKRTSQKIRPRLVAKSGAHSSISADRKGAGSNREPEGLPLSAGITLAS
jgi:hypothetical protein